MKFIFFLWTSQWGTQSVRSLPKVTYIVIGKSQILNTSYFYFAQVFCLHVSVHYIGAVLVESRKLELHMAVSFRVGAGNPVSLEGQLVLLTAEPSISLDPKALF